MLDLQVDRLAFNTTEAGASAERSHNLLSRYGEPGIIMKYIKIHWIHNFKEEPEFIYSKIDKEGYEVKKVEIFKNGHYIIYSENNNSDRLAEGIYPSLEELTFEEESESMQAIEISEKEFNEVWSRYSNEQC